MRRKTSYPASKARNSIYCRDGVGLISVAHGQLAVAISFFKPASIVFAFGAQGARSMNILGINNQLVRKVVNCPVI
ncbi:hypothetical protein ACNKHW_19840 [Shigella flexneri]